MNLLRVVCLLVAACQCEVLLTAQEKILPNTAPLILKQKTDYSVEMVQGVHTWLEEATKNSRNARKKLWHRDFSSLKAYTQSVEPNRIRLRKIIGAIGQRVLPVNMDYLSGTDQPALIAQSEYYDVFSVRWNVFRNVHGEGLLLKPRKKPVASIIAIPDADQTPEMLAGLEKGIPPQSQFARKLAIIGCEVLIPTLLNRNSTFSGNPNIKMTNATHREWIWRQTCDMGRHIIGYEVQKIEAAVDWFRKRSPESQRSLGVIGYGEGGLIAFYSAALNKQIDATCVSGYFDSRQQMWAEPIYRSLFGFLTEFGDAEIASLIAPRRLIIEQSQGPHIEGPPDVQLGQSQTAAPGRIISPVNETVAQEFARAKELCRSPSGFSVEFMNRVINNNGNPVPVGSVATLSLFLGALDVKELITDERPKDQQKIIRNIDDVQQQQRQVAELVDYSQAVLRNSDSIRAAYWKKAMPTTAADWPKQNRAYKQKLWNDIIGKHPDELSPPRARSRILEKQEKFTTYEVKMDVSPHLFAWGYLLLPKGIQPGVQRPVVVCQHGLEGLPQSVTTEDRSSRAWRAYRGFASQLARRGFIVYAPHNPYRGETRFRQIQRKANPLKLTLYSFILQQHQQQLNWLGSLPFVDKKRIGFYGLSYGGTTAVRVPGLLDGYALSICSAAFNDWASKVISNKFRSSYLFTREYDHFSFNLAATFNNAELVALIAPRPFMVERGHSDGVAPDEWVASEYAKVRRLYARLGIPERTEIEFFSGRHEIHGRGTFNFLHHHLQWPKPPSIE